MVVMISLHDMRMQHGCPLIAGTLVSLYNAGTERYLQADGADGIVGTQSLSAAPYIPTNPKWLFYLTIVNATEGA